jgi:hypothetical protein
VDQFGPDLVSFFLASARLLSFSALMASRSASSWARSRVWLRIISCAMLAGSTSAVEAAEASLEVGGEGGGAVAVPT